MKPDHRMTGRGFGLLLVLFSLARAWPYIGNGPFLGDQVDQLQNGLGLLSGRMASLYGPYMSNTNPLAFMAGPIAHGMYALPTLLGFDPDGVHAFFAILISLAILPLYFTLRRFAPTLSVVWCSLLVAAPAHNVLYESLWVNTLLVPACFLLLAQWLRFLRRPDLSGFVLLTALFGFGLHVHLIFVVNLPLLVIAIPRIRWHLKSDTKAWAFSVLALALAALPYLTAEVHTKWRNTKSLAANIGRSAETGEGLWTAIDISAGPATMLGALRPSDLAQSPWPLIALSCAMLVAVILWIACQFRYSFKRRSHVTRSVRRSLWSAFVVILAFQFLFFWKIDRPYNDWHYGYVAYPLCFLPAATFIAYLLRKKRLLAMGIGAAALVLALVWPYPEPHPWRFANIKNRLHEICAPTREIWTYELNHFAGPGGDLKHTLAYTASEHVDDCHWNEAPNTGTLLMPKLHEDHEARFQWMGKQYELKKVVPPGIGVYESID